MKTGKQVGQFTYLHTSALTQGQAEVIDEAAKVAGTVNGIPPFNVVKVKLITWVKEANGKGTPERLPDPTCISLLEYPDFFEAAFPALRESYKVNLDTGSVKWLSHRNNQPILHRKELLLPANHPKRAKFAALTRQAEQAGLFANTRIIGRVEAWIALLKEKGLRVVDHDLVPLG